MTIIEPRPVDHPHRPRPDHQPAADHLEISQDELTAWIRQLRAAAYHAGRRIPGRPALAQLTGANPYRIRQALEEIARDERSTPTPVRPTASVAPAPPTDEEPPDTAAEPGPAFRPDLIPDHQEPASQPASDQNMAIAAAPGNPTETVAPVGATSTPVATRPAGRPTSTWPLVIIGLAAAISVWSGWVGLGQLAGFGVIQPLPGVWDDLHLNSAIVLPISVEAYAAYALRCWLTSRSIIPRARTFARWSAITSLAIGAGAQIAFHLMTAAGLTRAPWPITIGVATIPVVVLGLATALANLIRVDGPTTPEPRPVPTQTAEHLPPDSHGPDVGAAA